MPLPDNQYEIAAGVVQRYRAVVATLDAELAEIEASIRRLATLPESYARERLRNTKVQMIDVMKRIESGAAGRGTRSRSCYDGEAAAVSASRTRGTT